MTLEEANRRYEVEADNPYGGAFVAAVRRFQSGFLADGVTDDVDAAFCRAVDASVRLLPVIKMRAARSAVSQ